MSDEEPTVCRAFKNFDLLNPNSPFRDEETKAWGGEGTCPASTAQEQSPDRTAVRRGQTHVPALRFHQRPHETGLLTSPVDRGGNRFRVDRPQTQGHTAGVAEPGWNPSRLLNLEPGLRSTLFLPLHAVASQPHCLGPSEGQPVFGTFSYQDLQLNARQS